MSEAKVTWASLPRKDQLLILFLVRFCEPIVKVSISAYVYFQLQWLDPSLPSAKVVQQVTLLQAAYTVAQGLASMFLGTIADSPRGGRKFVVVMSLFGSCMFFFFSFFFDVIPLFSLHWYFVEDADLDAQLLPVPFLALWPISNRPLPSVSSKVSPMATSPWFAP